MDNCSFGEVSRNMIDNLDSDFKEFKTEIRKEFIDLRATNTKLYNHLSSRLPLWATAMGILGTAIITGLVGRILW